MLGRSRETADFLFFISSKYLIVCFKIELPRQAERIVGFI